MPRVYPRVSTMAPPLVDVDEPLDFPNAEPVTRYTYNALADDAKQLHAAIPARHEVLAGDAKAAGEHARVCGALQSRKPVLFLPNDLNENMAYGRDDWKGRYRLNLFGILQDGSKAHVVIDDVPVFFDIWLPETRVGVDHPDADAFPVVMEALFKQYGCVSHEVGRAYPLKGYRKDPRAYVRLFFRDLTGREKAIQETRNAGHDTASDDPKSSYYHLVSRVYGLSLCNWLAINKYDHSVGGSGCRCHGVTSPVDEASPLCAHVLKTPLANIKSVVHPLVPDDGIEDKISAVASLARDRSLVMTWDIETHSVDRHLGTVPDAAKPDDVVFMLCATLHYRTDPKPLACVCLTTQETAPDPRWTTVVCGAGGNRPDANPGHGQASLIMAFAHLYRAWAPEFITGFCCGHYDHPFVIEKARTLGLLVPMYQLMSAIPRKKTSDENILKWEFKMGRSVKITAEVNAYVSYMNFAGSVSIDTQLAYLLSNPTTVNKNLNSILSQCRLNSKANMKYTLMWDYYEVALAEANAGRALSAGDAENMRLVAHYCVVDALRCQEILAKKNLIAGRREKANLSFTSFNDAFYRADGHKVANLTLAYGICSAALIGFQMIGSARAALGAGEDKEKLEGGFVVAPERGLNEIVPLVGLDAKSLYPNVMKTYNMSLDKHLAGEEDVARAAADGEDVYVDKISDTLTACFVRHGNQDRKRGIFSRALADLGDKRDVLKIKLKLCEKQIEFAERFVGNFEKTRGGSAFAEHHKDWVAKLAPESLADKAFEKRAAEINDFFAGRPAGESSASTLHAFHDRLGNIQYAYASVDAKQKAVKVFMNTFYGVTGTATSPIYLLALAAAVTAAGRRTLKFVMTIVLEVKVTVSDLYGGTIDVADLEVKYGDTDSVYVSPPPQAFAADQGKYDEAVAALWEQERAGSPGVLALEDAKGLSPTYWLRDMFVGRPEFEAKVRELYENLCKYKVKLTMVILTAVRDVVNARLIADNGSEFLKFAYEEVLFPCVLAGKKKYFGVEHIYAPNFNIADADKLFVRGIDIIKKGQTELARVIGKRCMWEATRLCPPGTRVPLTERVEEVLRTSCAGAGRFLPSDAREDSEWTLQHFVQSDAWKPGVDNKSVQNFMRRMRGCHAAQVEENKVRQLNGEDALPLDYVEPEPGSRFEYLICNKNAGFDLQGYARAKPAKGDLMEYVHVAKRYDLAVNVEYYLNHYVVSLCARFISCADAFQPVPSFAGQAFTAKECDVESQKAAAAHLKSFIKAVVGGGGAATATGYAYKRAYRAAAGRVQDILSAQTRGLFADGLVCAKAVHAITPTERAHLGFVNYETFINLEDDSLSGFGAGAYVERLRIAAAARADSVLAMLEEPLPAWDPVNLCLASPGSRSSWKGLVGHQVADLGVDAKTEEGKAALYRLLKMARPARRTVNYRTGRPARAAPTPRELEDRFLSEDERNAVGLLAQCVSPIAAIAERVQASLVTLVDSYRRTDILPEADAEEATPPSHAEAGAEAGLALSPSEIEALRRVQSIWDQLVGISLWRATRRSFDSRLGQIRDAL
jgi:DNA polymerase elongation subunit (family B)